jgi:hypothetical protein
MNRPDFLAFRLRATYCWKALDEGYNFASELINRRFEEKVMGPQSCGSPKFENFKTSTWESQDKKTIWMWLSWKGVELYYKGEGGGFPQV